MPSRWMAPKLAKMRRPYTDHELMIMGAAHRPPPPDVLDAIAEEKFWQGWDSPRHALCTACRQLTSANGQCAACEMYVPAPPRSLQQRQDARRAAVMVDAMTPKPRRSRRETPAHARKLAQMGLR
jgi:hypothetical protein